MFTPRVLAEKVPGVTTLVVSSSTSHLNPLTGLPSWSTTVTVNAWSIDGIQIRHSMINTKKYKKLLPSFLKRFVSDIKASFQRFVE
jgi:hypothetical protein